MATRQRKETSRATKATSRKAASSSDVEIVEEAPGLGLDAGMGIVTALLLVVALILLDMDRGSETGDGMFFKSSPNSTR